MTAPRTVLHVLHDQAAQLGDRPALWSVRGGTYLPTTWRQYAARVKHFALALHKLGFGPGDVLAILSFNREEWSVAALAAMSLGGAFTGIYTTSSPEQMEHLLTHSGAKVVLVENETYLKAIQALRSKVASLQQVIVIQPPLKLPAKVKSYAQVMVSGQRLDESIYYEHVNALQPHALAVLIYTSGTTGHPKGVMLTHHNLIWTAEKLSQYSQLSDRESIVSYLPMAHIAEQLCSLYLPLTNGIQVYFARSFDSLGEDLRRARPTLMFGVPRVWEKLMAKAEEAIATLPPPRRKVLEWARGIARQRHALELANARVPASLEAQYVVAQRLVFKPLKAKLGFSKTWLFITGAAPIGKQVLEFFVSLDMVIREVYGQSEGSGPTTVSVEGATKLGRLGRPMLGVEVKIAQDGEILVRGGNVCRGYYKDEAATEQLLQGGWLHSGDLGEMDDEGYLRITGRKKELIVTSGGKKASPANIEELLRAVPPVGQAIVVGDQRNYLVALVTLDPDRAKRFAQERGYPSEPAVLARDQRFKAFLFHEIERSVNPRLARYESIRKLAILPAELSVEGGELTPSLKIKRRIVESKYQAEIEALYAAPSITAPN